SFGAVTGSLVNAYAPFGWDETLPLMKQLEEWGMVTRGLLIASIPALQFMELETITILRGWQREPAPRIKVHITISAADPVNPYGTVLPWPDNAHANFARRPGNFLVFEDGVWVYWIESNGKHVVRISDGA